MAERSARRREASELAVATMQANTALPYILQHVNSDPSELEEAAQEEDVYAPRPYTMYGGGGGQREPTRSYDPSQPAQIYHPFVPGQPSPRPDSDIELATISKS